jgi:hypothetical protein
MRPLLNGRGVVMIELSTALDFDEHCGAEAHRQGANASFAGTVAVKAHRSTCARAVRRQRT